MTLFLQVGKARLRFGELLLEVRRVLEGVGVGDAQVGNARSGRQQRKHGRGRRRLGFRLGNRTGRDHSGLGDVEHVGLRDVAKGRKDLHQLLVMRRDRRCVLVLPQRNRAAADAQDLPHLPHGHAFAKAQELQRLAEGLGDRVAADLLDRLVAYDGRGQVNRRVLDRLREQPLVPTQQVHRAVEAFELRCVRDRRPLFPFLDQPAMSAHPICYVRH